MGILLCRTRQATAAVSAATDAATAVSNPTGMDLDLPVDPNEPTYCFCNQVSYGEMVACDNPDVCNFSYCHITSFILTCTIHNLTKILFLLTVQDRMVPFWLCWFERTTKRKLVLLQLHGNSETSKR